MTDPALKAAVEPDYVLMKRGLFYRPYLMGYTGIKEHAARYTKADAESHADPIPGVTALPFDEAPLIAPNCFDDVARDYLMGLVANRDVLIAAQAAALSSQASVMEEMVKGIAACEGEQEHFETWAKASRYEMHEHPLHYIFMNEKTYAARMGWIAALAYARTLGDTHLPVKKRGDVWHYDLTLGENRYRGSIVLSVIAPALLEDIAAKGELIEARTALSQYRTLGDRHDD